MRTASRQRRTVTPARRGQIVQRVLVDGWTAKQAAAASGVDERTVAAWVAAYRRDGMASLHRDPSKTSAIASRLWRPLSALLRRLAGALRRPGRRSEVGPSPLPRPHDDRRRGG
jgi:transposase-like protein